MSSAFVKEGDAQWLHDIDPTMLALVNYLTRENNGVRVYEKGHRATEKGRILYQMSNGLDYALDEHGRWEIVW